MMVFRARKFSFSLIAWAAILIGLPGFGNMIAARAGSDAAEFVRAIYGEDSQPVTSGLPKGGFLALFDTELRRLLEKAARIDREFAAKYPDEKPPFVEFDPFRPLPDAHSSLRVHPVSEVDAPFLTSVVVEFQYRDETAGTPSRHTALLIYRLRVKEESFEIQDILVVDPREEVGVSSVREQLILALRTAEIGD